MKYFLIICSALLLFALTGCEEEDKCIGCGIDPKVTVRFDPTISRKAIEAQLTPINTRIKSLRDSLKLELPEDVVLKITNTLQVIRQDSSSVSGPLAYFKSGKIRLISISGPGTGFFEQWQDTVVNAVKIPVDMQHDTTTYYFSYHERSDTLQVRYERELVQTLSGMRMVLHNLNVVHEKTSFDSLIFKCPGGECSNDRATISILF
ncbi:MAG: hypothetical protein U5K79_11690 [Cyclobacteriaceae bacterium]|nr:hypothetical protein [Cyclobacteriaceae bacterium]